MLTSLYAMSSDACRAIYASAPSQQQYVKRLHMLISHKRTSPEDWRADRRSDPRPSYSKLFGGAVRSDRRAVRGPFGSSRERRLQIRQLHVRRRGKWKMVGSLSGERRVVYGEIADQAAWPTEDAIQCEDRSPRRETQD